MLRTTVIPTSVFRQLATRRGGGEVDSSGRGAAMKSGSSGVRAARGALEPELRPKGPSSSRGGERRCRRSSKPGGHDAVESEGARKSRARLAPPLVDDMENGVREMRAGDDSPPPANSRTCWSEPFDDGEEGQTAVGDMAGSGVAGGVRAALERRLLETGDAERWIDLPRGPEASRSWALASLSASASSSCQATMSASGSPAAAEDALVSPPSWACPASPIAGCTEAAEPAPGAGMATSLEAAEPAPGSGTATSPAAAAEPAPGSGTTTSPPAAAESAPGSSTRASRRRRLSLRLLERSLSRRSPCRC
jgi:hypothetical protein